MARGRTVRRVPTIGDTGRDTYTEETTGSYSDEEYPEDSGYYDTDEPYEEDTYEEEPYEDETYEEEPYEGEEPYEEVEEPPIRPTRGRGRREVPEEESSREECPRRPRRGEEESQRRHRDEVEEPRGRRRSISEGTEEDDRPRRPRRGTEEPVEDDRPRRPRRGTEEPRRPVRGTDSDEDDRPRRPRRDEEEDSPRRPRRGSEEEEPRGRRRGVGENDRPRRPQKGTEEEDERPRRPRRGSEEEEPRKRPKGKDKKSKKDKKEKPTKDKAKKSKGDPGKRVVSIDASEKEKRIDLDKFNIPVKPLIGVGAVVLIILIFIVYGLFFGKSEGFSSVLAKGQGHTIGHYRYTFDIISVTEEESAGSLLNEVGGDNDGLESKEEILSSGQTKGKVSKEWIDEAGIATDIEGTKLMPNLSIVVDGYTESLDPLTGRGTVRANFTKSSRNMFTLTDYKIIEGELYFNAQLLKDSLAKTNISFPVSLADTLPNGVNYVKVGSDVKVQELLSKNKDGLAFGSPEFIDAFTGKGNAFIRVLSAYLATLEESDPSIFNTEKESKYLIINSNTNPNALGYTQLLVGKLPTLLNNYNNMLSSSELKINEDAQSQQAEKLSVGIKTLSDYFSSITAEDLKQKGFVAQFRVRNNNSEGSTGFDSTSTITWKDLDDNSVHRLEFSTEFFDNELPDAEEVLELPKGEITEWSKWYSGTTKEFMKVMGGYFAKFALQSLQ